MGYSVSYHPSGNGIAFLSIDGPLSEKEVDEIVSLGPVNRIQSKGLLDVENLRQLNDTYFSIYPQTAFRLYNLPEDYDLTGLSHLSNLRKLSIESYNNVRNITVLSSLTQLKSLRFDVLLCKDFDFITYISEGLEQLSVSTKSTALDLSSMIRFDNLEVLYLHGYKKNIEAISTLTCLKSLSLVGVSPGSLEFLNEISSLRTLKLLRGNKLDLSVLYGNPHINALQLFRISHLDNVDLISELPKLQVLELSQLPHINAFPDVSKHTSLEHIALDDLKTLTDFSALEYSKSLKTVSFSVCPSILTPDDILPILRNKSVEMCCFYTASAKKNEQFSKMIDSYKKVNGSNLMMVREQLFSNFTEF